MAYRRILPRERSIFSYAELWAEEDHLLSVKSQRLNVNYQRFPLAEIQAISITTLPHWTVAQIAWLFVSGLLFFMTALTPRLPALGFFFGLFTVWPFVLALREVFRGPRCRTLIHTATGAHELPAVGRQGRVAEFLAVVTPLIEGVQGRAERLEVTERAVEHPEETARGVITRDKGLRLFLFGALLAEGIFSAVMWALPKVADKLEVAFLSLGIYVSVLAVALAVWNRSTPVLRRDRVYVLVGLGLGIALVELIGGIVWLTLAGIGGRETQMDRWMNLAGAVWRIPLALVALAIDLRRK